MARSNVLSRKSARVPEGSTEREPSSESSGSRDSGGRIDPQVLRGWVIPIAVLFTITVGGFLIMRFVDGMVTGQSFFSALFLNKADAIDGAMGNFAQVMVGLLALVITVVAIVVQLAAQRYTPKLVDLFINDKVNVSFFLLLVITSIYTMLMAYSAKEPLLPYWSGVLLLVLMVINLLLLAPYFSYVFRVLTPENIIGIIRSNAKTAMELVSQGKSGKGRPTDLKKLQQDVANAMEQISDISLSAVSQMDRNVALLSIRSLKDVLVDHLLLKRRMPNRWFIPAKENFQAISSDFLHEIAVTRTWVEVKGFLDLELIFKMAIKEMPDGVSAIANSTKIIGLYAMRLKDRQVLEGVVIQFFNTFLRHAVNDRNPKAIYNLFYQYRLLAEQVMRVDPPLAEKICFYFKYYGQAAQVYEIQMSIITAAFDLAHLLERAYEMKVPNLAALVTIFLEVDDNPATQANEFDLRSVRKAQLMFASFLLSKGDTTIVQRIFQDIKTEPKPRMDAVRKEMLAVKDRKFWEVTDRGVNLFYMDEEQKKHLEVFFTRFLEPYWAEQARQLPQQTTGKPA
jgi:Predicted membrane protein (DUF2254)